ncbi:acetyltransferase [Streptomyces sp. SAT1]|uniref:GNAT family N-acetyltransferase n=1 Tax=Streptomyces sp. SAT1 TaxID=1849967 RepID=UPI0007DD82AD|nr:GNAT family N-acetyltransferase [Streptomyces sp. SAT1]ANH94274.1 acetyltransferase [Streptomyces sp. SAT1]
MSGPRVREMALADCDRVAEIRVHGWRTAYRDLMPRSFLDALSVERDAELRRALLARHDSGTTDLVAVGAPPGPPGRSGQPGDDGEVLGWACHGPCRDGEGTTGGAELYALYVDVRRHGHGIGYALLTESMRRCAAAGHRRMSLWVVEGNARARRFYERAGFRADGAVDSSDVDGVAVPEVRYVRELTG